PDGTQDILVRDAQILQVNFCGVFSRAQRVHDAAHLKTRPGSFYNEAGDASTALVRARARKDEAIVSAVRPANPQLGPIQHPVIAVWARPCLDGARRVAAA